MFEKKKSFIQNKIKIVFALPRSSEARIHRYYFLQEIVRFLEELAPLAILLFQLVFLRSFFFLFIQVFR